MRRVQTHIRQPDQSGDLFWISLIPRALLAPITLLVAWLMGLTGIRFHLAAIKIGFRLMLVRGEGFREKWSEIYSLVFEPIDSIRYFELGYLWQQISTLPEITSYLDVASPRLFPLELIKRNTGTKAILVNPDMIDLEFTERVVQALQVDDRVICKKLKIEDLDMEANSFDLITSVSVLEHIPDEESAIQIIWNMLKPGGVLLISLPCAAEAFEEYVNVDEYQLYPVSDDGFVFGQHFYDEATLQDRFFRLIGAPIASQVYGEKSNGFFFRDREQKNRRGHRYPFWSEPLRTSKNWQAYESISALPGVGVIILKFQKE